MIFNGGVIQKHKQWFEKPRTNRKMSCTHSSEYALSDIVDHFKLPQLVTAVTGFHAENNEQDFSFSSGQQMIVHALHKNGSVLARTFSDEPQEVYISTSCDQLVELRPNGTKDLFDDCQYNFQEIMAHFQFPLLVQFVDFQTDNEIVNLYTQVLKLEKIIKEKMVLCSTVQNNKVFLHVVPKSLDISVSVNQHNMNSFEKTARITKAKKEPFYEELKLSKVSDYMTMQTYKSEERSEMENFSPTNAQSSHTTKQSQPATTTSLLINFEDNPEYELPYYNYTDTLKRLPLPDEQTRCKETNVFQFGSVSEREQTDISKLSVAEVTELLFSHNMGDLAERFKMEEIDGSMLKDLDEESLKALGLNAFQAKKLLKLARGWKPKVNKQEQLLVTEV